MLTRSRPRSSLSKECAAGLYHVVNSLLIDIQVGHQPHDLTPAHQDTPPGQVCCQRRSLRLIVNDNKHHIGLNGRVFTMYKFRSMRVDTDSERCISHH